MFLRKMSYNESVELANRFEEYRSPSSGLISSYEYLMGCIAEWSASNLFNTPAAPLFAIVDKSNAEIGFVALTKAPNHIGTIRYIVIAEPYRNLGLGKATMQLIQSWMSLNGCKYVRFVADKSSTKFYEKLGIKWLGCTKGKLQVAFYPVIAPDFQYNTELMFTNYNRTLLNVPSYIRRLQYNRLEHCYYDLKV